MSERTVRCNYCHQLLHLPPLASATVPIPDGERAEEVARKEREARFIAQCAVSQPTTPVPDGERVAKLPPFDPRLQLPGEYEAGRIIREAVDCDDEGPGRFYLTCSVGELAQRLVASARLQPAAQQDALLDLAETAWGIIANAGEGRWETQTAEWQAAAARWRDRYHTALRAALAATKESSR